MNDIYVFMLCVENGNIKAAEEIMTRCSDWCLAIQITTAIQGPFSRTTWMSWYQKKHSLTHTLSLWLLYNIV